MCNIKWNNDNEINTQSEKSLTDSPGIFMDKFEIWGMGLNNNGFGICCMGILIILSL